MDVYVCVYSVFVLSCVSVAALGGLITRPRSPTVCIKKITKLKKRPGPNKGCSAIDEWNEFKCLPFFPVFIISRVSVMVAYVCRVFSMWFEYPELLLLLLMAWMCSLYLILNVLHVCIATLNAHNIYAYKPRNNILVAWSGSVEEQPIVHK
jgi:hypothetical protein